MLQAPSWLLASHGGDVTFTVYNRVKKSQFKYKKTKNNIFNKEEKKTNQSSRLLQPQMSNSPEKKSKIPKP